MVQLPTISWLGICRTSSQRRDRRRMILHQMVGGSRFRILVFLLSVGACGEGVGADGESSEVQTPVDFIDRRHGFIDLYGMPVDLTIEDSVPISGATVVRVVQYHGGCEAVPPPTITRTSETVRIRLEKESRSNYDASVRCPDILYDHHHYVTLEFDRTGEYTIIVEGYSEQRRSVIAVSQSLQVRPG